MKLVMVEWEDSSSMSGWMSRETARTHIPSDCVTFGLLINETSRHLSIVLSCSGYDSVNDVITIPKSSIKRIRKLRIYEEVR